MNSGVQCWLYGREGEEAGTISACGNPTERLETLCKLWLLLLLLLRATARNKMYEAFSMSQVHAKSFTHNNGLILYSSPLR